MPAATAPRQRKSPRTMRADELVLARGHAASHAEAAALILAGRVHAPGRRIAKPGLRIPADAELSVAPASRYVSRGGDKLRAALAAWPVDPAGRDCLDVGASTGGCTDCLLQHGAARVTAVDVGYGQLHSSLRADPRVHSRERTHIRDLDPPAPRPSLVVADLSFISLRSVLPHIAAVAAPFADLLALVKPQFEAPRADVPRDGVVRSPLVRSAAVAAVAASALADRWRIGGVLRSPLTGPAGNREYWLWLRAPAER